MQINDLTINEFTRYLAFGKSLDVYDADTWRPYCHVLDFCRLIDLVIHAPDEKVAFEVFNAGGATNNYTKQGIIDVILKFLPTANVKYQEHGPDPRNYRVDFSKVKKVLDFEPKYTVPYGIKELLKALNNNVFDNVDQCLETFGNYKITRFEK